MNFIKGELLNNRDLLLSINPFHLELLRPLVKWKILSIKELFEDSQYVGSYKNFHKIAAKLEKHQVLGSFKDVWTKSKRLHLTREGNQLVNPANWMAHAYNPQAFFHDSRVTLYLRYLVQKLNVKEVVLEQERMKIKSFRDLNIARPDAEFSIEGGNQKKISLLLEIELTQKSTERVYEKFKTYYKYPDYNYFLFVFPTMTLFKSYLHLFNTTREDSAPRFNYIFACEPGLIKGCFDLEKTVAWFKGNELTLQNVFTEITGGMNGDSKEMLKGFWRQTFVRGF